MDDLLSRLTFHAGNDPHLSKEDILRNVSEIVTVWGDGNRDNPYDRNRYHAGQLSMACAMSRFAANGKKVCALLTSDSSPRVTGQVPKSLYSRRKKDLERWLERFDGGNILTLDTAEEYRKIHEDLPSQLWVNAKKLLLELLDACEPVQYKIIEEGGNKNLDDFRLNLQNNRLNDEGWSETMDHCPNELINMVGKFIDLDKCEYPCLKQDIGALLYVLLFKKDNWAHWIASDWVTQLGVVISARLGEALIIEAKRNFHWLRAFRLLYHCSGNNGGIHFPRLASFENLSNCQGTGPMMGSDNEGKIPLFSNYSDINDKLKNCKEDTLHEIAIRISWAQESIPEIRQLLGIYDDYNEDQLRHAICEAISHLCNLWTKEEKDVLRIDSWFCMRYAYEVMANQTIKDRVKLGCSPSKADDNLQDISHYNELSNNIISKVFDNSSHHDVRISKEAIYKFVKHTSEMDILLHMTQKRYRDHGVHQIHTAVLGHLLLNSLIPSCKLVSPQKVVDRLASSLNIGSADMQALYLITALAHDHGYPLLQVAWLIGKLYSMISTGTGSVDNSRELATSLEKYVKPFSSKWFLSILDAIQAQNSCDPIAFECWERDQRNLAIDLLGSNPPQWPSHGIISAINLLNMIEEDTGVKVERKSNLYQVLRAIAIHDQPEIVVELEKSPFAFLLILSDELQEWSRRIFVEGRSRIESRWIELIGFTPIIEKSYQWQLPPILEVRFLHAGYEATHIPWEYNVFRESKKQNLKRLKWPANNEIFPNKMLFELLIGPENIITN